MLEAMAGFAVVENAHCVTTAWTEGGGFEVQIAGVISPICERLGFRHYPSGEILRG